MGLHYELLLPSWWRFPSSHELLHLSLRTTIPPGFSTGWPLMGYLGEGPSPASPDCFSDEPSRLPAPAPHPLHELHRRDVAQVDRRRVEARMTELLLDERYRYAFNRQLGSAGVA